MNPEVSIITAVRPGGSPYLKEAYHSILEQGLPRGSWEWLVQFDSAQDDAPPALLRDPHVRVEHNQVRQGAAGTRNYALRRANAPYVRNLDDDDLVLPGALRKAISVLDARPSVAFVTGPARDLFEGGRMMPVSGDLGPGLITPGTLSAHWRACGYLGIVHPSCIFARTEILFAFGGWAALAGSEDTALLLAISDICEGWQLPHPVLGYRRHRPPV